MKIVVHIHCGRGTTVCGMEDVTRSMRADSWKVGIPEDKNERRVSKAFSRCATTEVVGVLRRVWLARRTTTGLVGVVCRKGALGEWLGKHKMTNLSTLRSGNFHYSRHSGHIT